ncbi:MAG: hypothetical protein K6T78_07730 [Alicyclobacillus sp.]|nr:hypothetical protein [Alicyclobacillus sp.]
MANKWRRWLLLGAGTLACGVAAGCGPAVQSSANTQNQQTMGTPVPSSTWKRIVGAAEAGTQLTMYKEQMKATFTQGSLHSTFSVYGAINPPDRISLAITEGNTQTDYYQQGQTAYAYDNGRWSPSAPLSEADVYPSFLALAQAAQAAGEALYQLPRTYVQDEYCDVYRTVLPGEDLKLLPQWTSIAPGDVGRVLVTWYVGQTDGVLREVDTQSVAGIPRTGALQIDTTTLLFDLNNKIAQIQLPQSLIKELEGAGTGS